MTARRGVDSEVAALRPVQGVLVADATRADWPIVYVCQGFEALTGYSADEVMAGGCELLFGPATDRAALEALLESVGRGEQVTDRLLCYRKDGTSFLDEFVVFFIGDATGRRTQFVSVHTDITGLCKLEDQFRLAQKMEAMGLLAAGVAHDFNSLLTVINGYSDMLLEELPKGSPAREMVEEIRQAGERSADLTRQLLASSSRQVLAPRLLDLNVVVGKSERLLRRVVGEDVQLVCHLQEGLWGVVADPAHIEQVLMNLAVNARDAMPNGGTLKLETRNESDGSGMVSLLVSDTGCGIAEDVLPRVFEPFFTTKPQGQGTGLGLSTAYGIVIQSGGRLTLTSQEGKGATFTVQLPRADGHVCDGGVSPAEAARTQRVVLLVEDETGLRRLVRRILTRAGYSVLEAGDGGSAMALLDQHDGPIHLLLTDVVMPDANGPEVVRRARARDSSIKALYMSGYTSDDVLKRGVIREEVNFLPKPFTPARLLEKVKEVLGEGG